MFLIGPRTPLFPAAVVGAIFSLAPSNPRDVFTGGRDGATKGIPAMPRRRGVFTTGEVARICQVAPRTVSKWFDSGKLKGYRVPGSRDRRITVTELVRFLRAFGMPLTGLDLGDTRVLIVDPERRLGPTLETALNRQEFYAAKTVESAFAAGLEAAEFAPHLILVVPATPELRRAEFPRSAKESLRPAGFKLLAIASDQETASELRRAGFDDCLVRPFDIDDALRVIDALVQT